MLDLIHRLRQLHTVAGIIETWAPAPDGARAAIRVRREADELLVMACRRQGRHDAGQARQLCSAKEVQS